MDNKRFKQKNYRSKNLTLSKLKTPNKYYFFIETIKGIDANVRIN